MEEQYVILIYTLLLKFNIVYARLVYTEQSSKHLHVTHILHSH